MGECRYSEKARAAPRQGAMTALPQSGIQTHTTVSLTSTLPRVALE
ncbi:hypothetical protein BRAS3809_3500027 [Bradyrhizobium sp. STM 3809]|nr:hypothetical protein BRAS3809_3500027 [Bradyrhizobium sp. STM 3809]